MISKLRDYLERWRFVRELRRGRAGAAQPPPLDWRATYQSAPGETWTFEGGTVRLNGTDVLDLVIPAATEVSHCCQLIESLDAYRTWAFERRWLRFPRLAEAISAAQGRLLRQLHCCYDDRVAGIALAWDEAGELLINRLPVHTVVGLYRQRPTPKGRAFLRGLAAKLALILTRHGDRPETAGVVQGVSAVYHELCGLLAREAADPHSCLSAGGTGRE
ncbi:MAG: hypothetical protein HY696_07770 [Deltaproteobacteria bacterium]|nr:hypothetical protein [Deltaproteobacteria bacterium]